MTGIRVLIVDRSPEARVGIESILASAHGIEVVGRAATARRGIALAIELHPDVVLLDARLPDLGAAEVARDLRQQTPRVGLVVLAVHPHDAATALEAGADYTLMKDSPRVELVAAVRAAVRRRPGPEA